MTKVTTRKIAAGRHGKNKSLIADQQEVVGSVRDFWDQQAKEHGGSDLATAPDHHYRSLEIESILRVISAIKHENILDVGCGNGYSTIQIAKKFPEAMITGI